MVVVDVLIESVEQMQVMLMQKNHGEDRLSHKEGQGVARWSLAPVRNAEMPWQKMKFWRQKYKRNKNHWYTDIEKF